MEVTLFVKAGREADRLGSCLESQHAHLLMRLKQSEVKAVLVDVEKPPPEFTNAGFSRLPAVLLSDGSGNDDNVVAILEEKYPGGIIKPADQEDLQAAEKVTLGIYPAFCTYMMSGDQHDLQSALEALDEFLRNREHQFLFGNEMSLLDTLVLPQLHEIRVAVDRIKGNSIPMKLGWLWKYLFYAYRRTPFPKTCPPDLEICLDWIEKTGEPPSVIKMPEGLPEIEHGTYHSFKVPGLAVCPCRHPREEEVLLPSEESQ